MLIGILSIMSIGCIYVPLNPNDPIDRLAFLINDISAVVVLTQTHLNDKINQSCNKAINNQKLVIRIISILIMIILSMNLTMMIIISQ